MFWFFSKVRAIVHLGNFLCMKWRQRSVFWGRATLWISAKEFCHSFAMNYMLSEGFNNITKFIKNRNTYFPIFLPTKWTSDLASLKKFHPVAVPALSSSCSCVFALFLSPRWISENGTGLPKCIWRHISSVCTNCKECSPWSDVWFHQKWLSSYAETFHVSCAISNAKANKPSARVS